MLSVNIGPFASSLDRVLLLFAVIVALVVGAVLGRRRGVPVSGPLLNVLLIGLLVARLVFVARYFQEYRLHWIGIIDIRDGGFDPIGGLIGGLAFALWLLWRTPALRRPLSIALLTGSAVWGVTNAVIPLMDNQSRVLPQVALQTLDGKHAELKRFSAAGKPMVVNLWATWCPPCRREMPLLAAAQRQHPGITFVFVNQGEGPLEIQRYLSENSIALENVLLDIRSTLGRTVGSMALPTTLFYNADGRLVETHLGTLSRATLARGLSRAVRQKSK